MATELVSVAGRQAHIVQRITRTGDNSVDGIKVAFADTGETQWVTAKQITPVDAPEYILPGMSVDEAKAHVQAVKNAAQDMGKHLLELKEREGWRVLGYQSWTAFLNGEFEYSRKHLYELMAAVPVQDKLLPIGYNLSTKAAAALSKFDESLHVVIAQTAQARYGEVTESNINRVGDVVQTMVLTGHVSPDGISTPIDATLNAEDFEASQRQQVYVAEKVNQPHRTKLFDERGSLERVVHDFDWARFERLTDGLIVRLVLYVEEAE